MFYNLAVPFEENQLEIINCGLFVAYSCSWRMNFYEIMFLVFKGYMYHIHQRVNLHNFSRDDAPFTQNKGTGPAGKGRGGGYLRKLRWGCPACFLKA